MLQSHLFVLGWNFSSSMMDLRCQWSLTRIKRHCSDMMKLKSCRSRQCSELTFNVDIWHRYFMATLQKLTKWCFNNTKFCATSTLILQTVNVSGDFRRQNDEFPSHQPHVELFYAGGLTVADCWRQLYVCLVWRQICDTCGHLALLHQRYILFPTHCFNSNLTFIW